MPHTPRFFKGEERDVDILVRWHWHRFEERHSTLVDHFNVVEKLNSKLCVVLC